MMVFKKLKGVETDELLDKFMELKVGESFSFTFYAGDYRTLYVLRRK